MGTKFLTRQLLQISQLPVLPFLKLLFRLFLSLFSKYQCSSGLYLVPSSLLTLYTVSSLALCYCIYTDE